MSDSPAMRMPPDRGSMKQDAEAARPIRPNQVLAIVCMGVVLANLDLFIVNVALPDIARDFAGAGLDRLSWILNGYAIVYAALLVFFGRLAERHRRDLSFLLGVGLFTLASAACAAATRRAVLWNASRSSPPWGDLKLYGMKAAFDEIIKTAVKRSHEPQVIVGDLMQAEIAEKQARSTKYQITIAKLPLAMDDEELTFAGTPINETLVRDLTTGEFLAH